LNEEAVRRTLPVSEQQNFLRFAEHCHRLAEDGDVAGHRDTLEKMAHEWRRLASEEERIAELVRDVDTSLLHQAVH
jgi:hypothetical protein